MIPFRVRCFPETEQAATVHEVRGVGGGAGAVEEREELPHPPALRLVHAQPLDLLLEPPAIANCVSEHSRLWLSKGCPCPCPSGQQQYFTLRPYNYRLDWLCPFWILLVRAERILPPLTNWILSYKCTVCSSIPYARFLFVFIYAIFCLQTMCRE